MPPETDNLRLQELFEQDQQDRQEVFSTPAQVKELKHRDAMRRSLISEMISRGEVNTANDLYHAGVVLMHGDAPKDYLTAHRLAVTASILGHKSSRWLSAATLDRYLLSIGQPQIYGTQFEHNPEENQYQLKLPIDDASVLSFEKKFYAVPTVMERLKQLNARIVEK